MTHAPARGVVRRIEPGEARAALDGARAVLDARDDAAFARGHWPGAGHVPIAELESRRTELPPRDVPLVVVAASAEDAEHAAQAVASLGYADVRWLAAAIAGVAGADDRAPAARLWRPAPFLEHVMPRLVAARPRGRALDLAAGAGRESVFLALHGFEVEAVDDDRDILASAAALAARHGVTITTTRIDLERREVALAEAAYDVVTVFRFLHRPLFPAIERAIAPGGFLVYETYRRGQERFGRPKHPRFLLDDGELATAFPSLSVEHCEEPSPAEGPITARLLARRPRPSDRSNCRAGRPF